MKVLYIGYYREKSDWGRQTVNNILALEGAGVDVVCRSIQLGGTETPDALLHLEKKDAGDATHCIQHVFPEHMVGSSKFERNIGILSNNFVRMWHSSWGARLSMMDEIWMASKVGIMQNIPSNLDSEVKYVPSAIDTDVYNRRYGNLNIKEVENDFKVYTFATANDIQGLSWVLSTFHSEFENTDPVSLVIYLKAASEDSKKELETVESLSRNIKDLLRLNSSPDLYKKDVIISSPNISETNLFELHQYCDCYVTSNTEFTFPYSEIDAAGFGNQPIVSDIGSITEYIGMASATPSIYQTVQAKGGMFADTNNGRDYWIRPDELYMKTGLRQAFNEWKSDPMASKLKNKKSALEQLEQFSLENVGQKMKEALNV